jgi:hypothetical protein
MRKFNNIWFTDIGKTVSINFNNDKMQFQKMNQERRRHFEALTWVQTYSVNQNKAAYPFTLVSHSDANVR